jgi:hypothetical protein
MIITCIRGMYTPGDGMQDWVQRFFVGFIMAAINILP